MTDELLRDALTEELEFQFGGLVSGSTADFAVTARNIIRSEGMQAALAATPTRKHMSGCAGVNCDPHESDTYAACRCWCHTDTPEMHALKKAARDIVWTLFVRCRHDNEGHNLSAIEAYFVRRWLREVAD